jgi:hypothetical protein
MPSWLEGPFIFSCLALALFLQWRALNTPSPPKGSRRGGPFARTRLGVILGLAVFGIGLLVAGLDQWLYAAAALPVFSLGFLLARRDGR